MPTRFLQATFRLIVLDVVGNLLHFPIWWYSSGMKAAFFLALRQIRSMADYFALPILFKYWFKPMFGQSDVWGRLISFGVRTVQLIVFSIFQGIWSVLILALFLIWPLFPIFATLEFLFQFGVLPQFLPL